MMEISKELSIVSPNLSRNYMCPRNYNPANKHYCGKLVAIVKTIGNELFAPLRGNFE